MIIMEKETVHNKRFWLSTIKSNRKLVALLGLAFVAAMSRKFKQLEFFLMFKQPNSHKQMKENWSNHDSFFQCWSEYYVHNWW